MQQASIVSQNIKRWGFYWVTQIVTVTCHIFGEKKIYITDSYKDKIWLHTIIISIVDSQKATSDWEERQNLYFYSPPLSPLYRTVNKLTEIVTSFPFSSSRFAPHSSGLNFFFPVSSISNVFLVPLFCKGCCPGYKNKCVTNYCHPHHLKAAIPHMLAWLYFKMNCHQNIKLHHSFIYLYQTRIVIHNTSLNINILRLLSSYIFKPLQRFIMKILT